ncbi:hypothetical protein UFOVP1328_56 [uncultured Caudovirales phage]|uniref:Uncharacterized protein n=1 Tax=uncultured Caudovirales phage TaxID=2100421 RepID=A0A6J5RR05_9CAUD|nr:hypothetical protein UFOVP1328_56 [uncultured Caudovirales phage]CAB5228344.1 hypothetical protein UFOVP1532_24 [uncultured Caudovirales phage]
MNTDGLRDGDKVKDRYGRTGTIQVGWATGTVSLVWDDEPLTACHYWPQEISLV